MADHERLIADIMEGQQQLQHLFAYDRSDPLFNSQLTLPQLKILMLLHRLGDTSGRELAGLLGVSLATLSGMVDRLVAHALVTRAEDPHDRRVRRIRLSVNGTEMVTRIITAGTEKQVRLLRKLTADELRTVRDATLAMVRAATEDAADTEARDLADTAADVLSQEAAGVLAQEAADVLSREAGKRAGRP